MTNQPLNMVRLQLDVEPMPDPVKPIYMRNIDIAGVVTGGEE